METVYRTDKKVRLNLVFPGKLAAEVAELSKESGLSITEWVRMALARFIGEVQKQRLEKELVAECKLFCQDDKKLVEEWEATETDI